MKCKSNLVGIVIPQTEQGEEFMFDNPYYAEILNRVEYIARNRGYDILILGNNANRSYLNIAKERGLDGIIMIGIYTDNLIADFRDIELPIVICDSYGMGNYFNHVGTNDQYAGYLATKYLLDKGHKKIAFVTGEKREEGVNYYRYLGYKNALKEYNIDFDDSMIYSGYVDIDHGIEVEKKIIEDDIGITAIFATADMLAVGIVNGFHTLGIKVPEDISIIGFDDIYFARMCIPPLTTVRQNIGEKGSKVMELLLDILEGVALSKQDIIIPVEIEERNFVKEIKKI